MRKSLRYPIYYLLIIYGSLISIVTHAFTIDDVDFITENYPPYNYLDNGKLQGLSIDLLLLMLEKLESKQSLGDISIKPWARGYNTLLVSPNTCLFSVVKTEERENLFKWIGPISSISIALIARKDRHIKINTKEDIFSYKIGVAREDVGEQLLLKMGIDKNDLDHLGGINVIAQSIKKLDKGRLDAIAYDDRAVFRIIKKYGFNANNYEVVHVLNKGELYFACNREMPDLQIHNLQHALDELKQEGVYQEILNRY